MFPVRFLSVCSGIEAATVASAPLGWTAAGYAEINPFCCALLKQKYPGVPNYGDFTTIRGDELGTVDAIVGGTPCQDFSVAGRRAGLDGARGNLTLEFVRLVERVRPRWLFWENVPGVLSIDGGRAFGAFLGALAQLRYGWSYRVLDAQYFGVPQRRRRVFVVGCLGAWQPSAAVLFEPESVCRHSPPRREARERVAPTISARTQGGGGLGTDFDCDGGLVAGTLAASGAGSERPAGNANETDLVIPVGFDLAQITSAVNRSNPQPGDAQPPLCAAGQPHIAIPILEAGARTGKSTTDTRAGMGIGSDGDPMFTLQAGKQHAVGVRRLTPCECERLQGFPDDYTLIQYRGKPASDGPRYKALGNSWAVPCVRWIFERMDAANTLLQTCPET